MRTSATSGLLLGLIVIQVPACGPRNSADRASLRGVDAARGQRPPDPVVGGSTDGAARLPDTGAATDAIASGRADRPADTRGVVASTDSAPTADGPARPPPPAASPDAAAPPPVTDPVPLPLAVSEHFPLQGWFADGTVARFFGTGSTMIRQAPSGAGPCAARRPGARGQCLEVIYTPPDGLAAPAEGGWVGSYFLAPLRADHTEQNPPLQVGEGNWGIEPGLRVTAGATRVSFLVAGVEAAPISFLVGSDQDGFILPELTVQATTTWTRQNIAMGGARYDRVLTPFAWLLKNTTAPARFYLDDVVWERAP